jgi:ATP-dependent protease ClpP protease subunit
MDLRKLLNTAPATEWEKAVPIIKTNHHTDAYLTDGIDEPANYNELCHILRTSLKGDTITLHLNTPGGMVDSAFMIVDAIKAAKAKVTAYLTGTVASAGTIITLACDRVEAADHTSFMIHNYSAGMVGKGHEMKARQEFMDTSLNAAFKEFYSGFLTDKEMEDIIDGKDMWMGKSEVLERWEYKTGRIKRGSSTSIDTVEE